MEKTKFTVGEDKKTLIIERTFQAPRRRVWAAWTTPELFVKWWGPKGWTTTVKHMDFSNAGYLHYGMKCEDPDQTDWYGKISWGKSTYHDIDAENAFSYVDEFCDENGEVTPGMPAMDIQQEFEDKGNATRVISTTIFDSPEALKQVIDMGMQEGLAQTWDRLEELLG